MRHLLAALVPHALTWAVSVQRGWIRSSSATFHRLFRHPRSEPDCMTRQLPARIKLTYGRPAEQLHQHPACGGHGLRTTKPFSEAAV